MPQVVPIEPGLLRRIPHLGRVNLPSDDESIPALVGVQPQQSVGPLAVQGERREVPGDGESGDRPPAGELVVGVQEDQTLQRNRGDGGVIR